METQDIMYIFKMLNYIYDDDELGLEQVLLIHYQVIPYRTSEDQLAPQKLVLSNFIEIVRISILLLACGIGL